MNDDFGAVASRGRRRARWRSGPLLTVLAGASVLLSSSIARAEVRLEVSSGQGHEAPWVVGWNEVIVSLDNGDATAFKGTVAVQPMYASHGDRVLCRVPISLAPGEGARVQMPFYLSPGTMIQITLDDASGGELKSSSPLGPTQPADATSTIVEVQPTGARGDKLVDTSSTLDESPLPSPSAHPDDDDDDHGSRDPSPRADGVVPVRSTVAAPHASPTTHSPSFGRPLLQVSTAIVAKETGDPLLPDVEAGWTGAALVVIPSDVLARLSGRPLDALVRWVGGGGTMAIAVAREEDLKAPTLTKLLGGEARRTTPADVEEAKFSGAALLSLRLTRQGDDADVARYGLGETWLLRRDPWGRRISIESQRTIRALWDRGRTHRQSLLAGSAAFGLPWQDGAELQDFLDPNASFRPSLGIAAIAVAIYALLVGPIAFARARRLGNPLSVLRTVPAFAVTLFVALAVVGRTGKGAFGRARRVEIVDVGSGASFGASQRYESFYVPEPASLVRAVDAPIDVLRIVDPSDDTTPLTLDRNGASISGTRAHPWETVVVQSSGARSVPGGIDLEGSGSNLALVNHTPWTLEHVVLHPDGSDTGPTPHSRYFRRVAPGARVVAGDGTIVYRTPTPEGFPSDEPSPLAATDQAQTRAFFEGLRAQIALWGASTTPPLSVLPATMSVATMIVNKPSSDGRAAGYSLDRDILYLRVVGGEPSEAPARPKSSPSPLRAPGKEPEL